jgi:capsular exopolysaccharide synthesis family protein
MPDFFPNDPELRRLKLRGSSPTHGVAPVAPDERGPDWRRVGNAVRRRKWFVLAFTLAAGGVGYAVSRYVKPQYQARATVWIDGSNQRDNPGPLAPTSLFDAEGWVNLMHSDAVLNPVVATRRLYIDVAEPTSADSALFAGIAPTPQTRPGHYQLTVEPDANRYTLATDDGLILERATAGDSLGQAIGLRWLPPADLAGRGGTHQFTVQPPGAVTEQLIANLDVSINQQGSYLNATLSGSNPQRTAATLNAITQRYVALATSLQRQRLDEQSAVLSQQVAVAKMSLDSAEHRLEQFRIRTITLPHDRPGTVMSGVGPAASDMTPSEQVLNRFATIEDRLAVARADRDALERLMAASPDTAASLAGFGDLPVVRGASNLASAFTALDQAEASLVKMRERYTDAYPPVVQLKAQITELRRTTIPRTASALVADLNRRTRDLTNEVSQTADSLRAIPPRATDEARLMRNVAMATNLYTTLQQRYDETRIARATDVSDVRILDAATVPPWPTKNLASRLILLALAGGLGVAMLVAILLDRWDPRFRYPEEISRDMGMTILGTIPHLRLARDGTISDPAFPDCVRGIRMNLAYAYGAAGPVTLTISSPGSADGKSFLTLSLARAFADSGQRTVVIDGDVRRGALHRRCDLLRKPGLTDYLRGDVALEQVVRPTSIAGVHLVTSGTRMKEAPELLGSPAMRHLMGELKARFDVVLCDSPPLSAGIDPFVLGAVTANMLLVIRTGVSLRELTQAKLEILDRMPIRLLGVVLNDVPDTAPFQYYANYLPGYEAVSESTGPSATGKLTAGVT